MLRIQFILVIFFGHMCFSQDIIHVINEIQPSKNQKESITYEHLLTIGEEEDINKSFYKLADLTTDTENNIYVLDRGTKSIKKFDSKGNFIVSFGRSGQGPGEFLSPASIFFRDKRIYVLDRLSKRISLFSFDGEFISSFQTKTVQPVNFVVDNFRNLHVLEQNTDFRVYIYSENGDVIGQYGEIISGQNVFETYVLNNGHMDIDKSGYIYISFIQPYRIDKYNQQGELIATFTRKVKYKVVKPELDVTKEGRYTTVKNNFYTRISRDISVQGNYIYHLVTNGTDFLPLGKYIDVFTVEGDYVNTIDLGHCCEKIYVDSHDHLYTLIKPGIALPNQSIQGNSNVDYPRVDVYQISHNKNK